MPCTIWQPSPEVVRAIREAFADFNPDQDYSIVEIIERLHFHVPAMRGHLHRLSTVRNALTAAYPGTYQSVRSDKTSRAPSQGSSRRRHWRGLGGRPPECSE